MGPGSKPSSHAHSNPPITLVHVPFPQGLPMSHSFVSAWQRVGIIIQQTERERGVEREPTFTRDPADVQVVPHGALAPEGPVRVDALPVNARVIDALVDI